MNAPEKYQDIERVGILGAGVIGASWTSLFLAAGLQVDIYDVAKGVEKRVREFVGHAWPTLDSLGMTVKGNPKNINFHQSAADAVKNAQFIQENVPESIDSKHHIYKEIEPMLLPDAIVASSASGLMLKYLQTGWRDPSKIILGHPFNPPHLIPLVELLTNEMTANGVIERAENFYQRVGKITIRVKREVPAHVANRLQAALWKEAIHLVQSGVATVEDVDKAVWAGPGLRWATMGPHMLFHLGAGSGGIKEFCARYGDSFHRWWDDLGDVKITAEIIQRLADGIEEESKGNELKTKSDERDALIIEYLKGRERVINERRNKNVTTFANEQSAFSEK